MGGQSGLSELSVISWVYAAEGCPLSGVPLNKGEAKFTTIHVALRHLIGASVSEPPHW